MVNTQEWLDKNYPRSQRNGIRELDISQQNLESFLKLEGFTSLEKFTCGENQITSLEINQLNPNLKYFDCYDNLLTDTSFLQQLSYPQNLEYLYISNNNFSAQNLSFLTPFVNLEELYLGNYNKRKIQQGIYNRFTGSLRLLENMNKLTWLDITDTDINNGWEYLPTNLEQIGCLVKEKNDSKVKVIELTLAPYKISEDRRGWWKIDIQRTKVDFWMDKVKKEEFEAATSELKQTKEEIKDKKQQVINLETELQMEREEAQKALQKAQEWRERQLQEIVANKDKQIQQLQEEFQQAKAKTQKLNRIYFESSNILQRTGERLKENKNKRKALETQLTDTQEQFQSNQAEIEKLKAEINTKQALIETYSSNQELVSQLQAEKSHLEAQLTVKREILTSLQAENQELIQKCYFCLKLIEDFRKKQEEVETLENSLEGQVYKKSNPMFMELSIRAKELNKLESRLEKIIEEEKPILIKKLKMDNEDWEEQLIQGVSNLSLINALEKENRELINLYNNLWRGAVKSENNWQTQIIQTQPFGVPGSSKKGNN